MTNNTGVNNSGDWNSGDWNSGDWNSGDWNSGDRNSGDWNSGDRNSGDWNSGSWNSVSHETGYFNTEEEDTIRVFNKPVDRITWEQSVKPLLIYFDPCVWVDERCMTDEEKTNNKHFRVSGGYLKTLNYKEAFQASYAKASEEDKALLLELPNFDPDVFYEISGIDVREKKMSCAGKVVEIDGRKYKLTEV